MAVVLSSGSLVTMESTGWSLRPTGVRFYDGYNRDYAALYREQPNVRTCVDFLARNIAQLGLHVFRRVSDLDRVRLRDHGLVRVLNRPLPVGMKTTRYRLIESLMGDLGIYFNAYWLKVLDGEGQMGLLRLPPAFVEVRGGLIPLEYVMTIANKKKKYSPGEVVHFRGYNPESAILGLSPLETLRRVLAEEYASGRYREGFWQNAARMSGIVTRPMEAPEWSEVARERWTAEFAQLYSGDENSGKTAVLEDGMEWKPVTFSARDSEYLAGRKLTREECARAYHIPLPLVGILDNATFSNIQEQHKHLYQDSLGPWLAMIEQDIELQLLPDLGDATDVYVEFNIAEKMQGSFVEQTQALQAAVGRPWLTANEARAVMNRPQLPGDADLLVTPLNVLVGGQASPQDSAPERDTPRLPASQKAKRFDTTAPKLRERYQQQWAAALSRHYRRQEAALVGRVPKAAKQDIGGIWWDAERWDRELGADLFRLNHTTALAFAGYTVDQIGGEPVSEEMMLAWLQEHSRIQAEEINDRTKEAIAVALAEPDALEAVKNVFLVAISAWVVAEAVTAVTAVANFGAHEAANANNLRKKTWRVNSNNPRKSHKAMNGETVDIRDKFSNGLRWPGDPAGSAEDNARCRCSVEFE